jgi:protein-S-isoprenylcysteine O-methyltransferase Ste14
MPDHPPASSRPSPPAIARSLLIFLAVFGLAYFGAAGRLDLFWGWLYLGLYLLDLALTLLLVRDPELMEERRQGRRRQGAKSWDQLLSSVPAAGGLLTLVVAGLETGRFQWTQPLALWVHLLGLALQIISAGVLLWSMRANRFFSAIVRIQSERGHRVVSRGPYRFVRHPGYAGMILWLLSAPLLLGSLWGLLPAALSAALMLVRTALEDRTLRAELPGYPEYAQRVHWRLLPGVW